MKFVSLHIRRCHCCGTVNESLGELVTSCRKCGRHLVPFYYFDESRAMGKIREKDVDPMYEHHRVAALPREDYPSLRGLTVIWNEEGKVRRATQGRKSRTNKKSP